MKHLLRNILIFILFFCKVNGDAGRDLYLTQQEKQAFDTFKARMLPLIKDDGYMKSDLYLVRWLRFRNFDVKKAEAEFLQNLKWYDEENMKNIQTENMDDMARAFPATLDTYDMTGRPILILDIFDYNFRDIVINGKTKRTLRYFNKLFDAATRKVHEQQKKGLPVTQWVCVNNAEGFNMITLGCPMCTTVWVQFLRAIDTHYPGYMKEYITIEAPVPVHRTFNILMPLLPERTRNVVRVFGTNKVQWMKYLDSFISREERRYMYGGTKPPVKPT